MLCERPYMRYSGIVEKAHTVHYTAREAFSSFGCGKCLYCRINKSREWTHRMLLEQKMHEKSSFITLTYDDEHIPPNYSLAPKDLTLYLKRLRKKLDPKKFRYYAIGEYGDKTFRPHYHAALFGVGIEQEQEINEAWGLGHTMTGDLNKNSARYMTGYLIKPEKDLAELSKRKVEKEFMRCSKGTKKNQLGGIGASAVKKIGKNLKNNIHFEKRIIKELCHGKNSKPLGRYLIRKLAEEIGISEKEIYTEYWNYQQEVFESKKGEKSHYLEVQEEDREKRKQILKRSKIYKQRKRI